MISVVQRRLSNALDGLLETVRNDHAVQLHVLIMLCVILLALLLCLSVFSWALLLLAIGGVFTAELLNSAFERLTDRLHPGRDSTIQRSKDIAAAAVLASALVAIGIGCLVLLPPLFRGDILVCLL